MAPSSNLMFKVHRREPELVRPAKPTPYEVKLLSDIDDQEGLRFHIPVIQFYKHVPSMRGKDPVAVIRRALAETLVPYYPFAGRLREGHNRKLMVECTAEGVLFVEADADVRLTEFGDQLQPPFPCMKELLFDVAGSDAVLHSPLLLIQVTRLKCGSFIFALRLSHCMSDAPGLVQFMSAIGELARGSRTPSIPPVWERHFLSARSPPRLTHTHPEYEQQVTADDNDNTLTTMPLNSDNMAQQSFFFGHSQLSALRRHLPPHLRQCYSRFEILASCLWKCRTLALQPNPEEKMRMICLVSMRGKFSDPPLPVGYYGNTFAFPVAEAPAGELCGKPLGYALDLVRKAKGGVTEEYMKSVADLMVLKGRPDFLKTRWTYLVSDVTRAGFELVDFGWGAAVYGGPAEPDVGPIPGLANFCIPCKNKEGDDGIVLAISLPVQAMERFVKELQSMLSPAPIGDETKKFPYVMSAL